MILYAALPAQLSGPLISPQLAFHPGALLRSRGRVIDALNIDEIRWPLAGVKVTQQGVDGRLQAILRAHEQQMGDFTLHLDGQASDFLPDSGRWQWRYWGEDILPDAGALGCEGQRGVARQCYYPEQPLHRLR